MSDQGAQIRNPEGTTDRGPMRQCTAGGAARVALVQPQKCGSGPIFAAVLARPRQCFGPGVAPAPFLEVPINTPLGFFRGDIQRV